MGDQVKRPAPKGCTASNPDTGQQCQRARDHDGWHRAEVGPPVENELGQLEAQLESWSW